MSSLNGDSSNLKNFENRKADHIRLSLDNRTQAKVQNVFSKVKLIHNALPESNFSEVSLKSVLLGREFRSPHFVSSMTAGHSSSLQINLNLAKAAASNGWLMAVGSQRRELYDTLATVEWREIRKTVPDVKLVSNIGILELLKNSPEVILQLADNLNAIGIFIHLNALQEVFQGNQDINLEGALVQIEKLVKLAKIPVLVKEVGFGINDAICRSLFNVGVHVVDISGHGGTHWAYLEALRQSEGPLDESSCAAFNDWGLSTLDCLLSLQEQILFNQVWASGGVRNGVDSAKCLALGARAVGIAQPLMKAAVESEEKVSKVMNYFDFQLKTAMFCMGLKKCEDFLHKKVWYESNS